MEGESNSLFNPERQALHGQLGDLSPRLSGLYRRLIRLLDEKPEGSEHLARVSLIGHCVRELINRLPDILADVPDMLEPVIPKSGDMVRRLPGLTERYTETLAMVSGPTSEDGNHQRTDLVPVPRPLFEALHDITNATARETARAKERDAVVVARARTASGPAYARWRAARKFFMEFTHLDNHVGQEERQIPSDEQIIEHLGVVEAALSSRLTGFFDNRRILDEFLSEVNQPAPKQTPGTTTLYLSPERAKIRDVLTRIGSLQLRRVFYGSLKNPLWVAGLADEGAFKNPPEPWQDDGGNLRDEPWPEVDYLVSMAHAAPREVVDVALTLVRSKNAWVRRGLVEIAATVPIEDATRLASALRQWGPDFGWRTDPRHLVGMTESLLTGGHYRLGMKYASVLFHPREPRRNDPSVSAPVAGLEDYWYEEYLPRIANALGERRLSILVLWLEDYEKFAGRFDDANGRDLTYMSRPDIGSRQASASEIEAALIDAVRDAAVSQMEVAPVATVSLLLRSGQTLIKRICFFAAAHALANAKAESLDALISALRPLVPRAEFGEHGFRVEFSEFLRALSTVAGPDELLPIAATLEAGPLGSAERLREQIRAVESEDGKDIEAEVESYIARWRHRLLSTVGKDMLPGVLGGQLQELDLRFGPIEGPRSPDFSVRIGSGHLSPMNHGDMAAKGASDLLGHLETWHPDLQGWRGPSHEGQARELATMISTRPDVFEGFVDRVMALRPTYLRAVLRGWSEALQDGKSLPWTTVVDVVRQGAALPDASPFEVEGYGHDDDQDYSGVKAAAVTLAEAMVVKVQGRPTPPLADIIALAPVILGLISDTQLQRDYSTVPAEITDPFTLSMSRTLPVLVRALVALTGWDGFNAPHGPVVKALDEVLGRDDPHGAIAAVVGESLGILHANVGTWLKANTHRIFGGEGGQTLNQQIALSATLGTYQIHPAFLELLRVPITVALRRGMLPDSGWSGLRSSEQLLGDWILFTHIYGAISQDDGLMCLFFDSASPDLRANVMGRIGWTFMHAESVDPEILRRAEDLWDSRVAHVKENTSDAAELADFYWFVKSGKFAAAWWVPRLRQTVILLPSFGARGSIHEELAAASRQYPAAVLDIVKRLVGGSDDVYGAHYMVLELAVPQILASAFDSGDPEIAAEATLFMHQLGERGYIDLDAKVAACRAH